MIVGTEVADDDDPLVRLEHETDQLLHVVAVRVSEDAARQRQYEAIFPGWNLLFDHYLENWPAS